MFFTKNKEQVFTKNEIEQYIQAIQNGDGTMDTPNWLQSALKPIPQKEASQFDNIFEHAVRTLQFGALQAIVENERLQSIIWHTSANDLINHVKKESEHFLHVADKATNTQLLQTILQCAKSLATQTIDATFTTVTGQQLFTLTCDATRAGCSNNRLNHHDEEATRSPHDIRRFISKKIRPYYTSDVRRCLLRNI